MCIYQSFVLLKFVAVLCEYFEYIKFIQQSLYNDHVMMLTKTHRDSLQSTALNILSVMCIKNTIIIVCYIIIKFKYHTPKSITDNHDI